MLCFLISVDSQMSEINIDQLLKVLPRLIRENDTVKGAILTALSGVVATRDDIKELIREMDKRFEAVDKHFEAMQQQMDKRFEAVDKHFEAMERRFDGVDTQLKTITDTVIDIKRSFGAPFEQFARNVVSRILEGEGIPNVVLKKDKIPDKKGVVFPETKEIEIDGFSENPPVIVEITSILREKAKVETFLKKKAFVEKERGKKFRGFLIASGSNLTREELADINVMLKKNGAELINL